MTKELVPYSKMKVASQLADEVARQNVLERYLKVKSEETIKRQYWDIKAFENYLQEAHINVTGIALNLTHWKEEKLDLVGWQDITVGIVEGFVHWQLTKGYAIGSVNVRLSTIKTYCKLAYRAGFLPQEKLASILLVQSFRHKEGMNVDKGREVKRIGEKKADAIVLTKEQVRQLKVQPDTPQGWRDKVILCFFLDHGLRCGELASLLRSDIDLTSGKFHVYREKVDKHQNHKLTNDTLVALINYFRYVKLSPKQQLLMGSQKSKAGNKLAGGMSKRAITARVKTLGENIGVDDLSSHDGRHTWGTAAARAKTDLKSLTNAGGWSSIATPYNRYVQANDIANEDVKLDY